MSRSHKAAARRAADEAPPRLLLVTFIEAADALAATPVLQHADTFSSLKMSWTQGEPLTWTVTEPTPDQLDLLRYRLRPFLLGDDWTHVKHMYSLLTQQVRSDELRGYVVDAARKWRKAQKHDGFGLVINGRAISPWQSAELFFYAGERPFHYDLARRDELQRLGFEGIVLTRQKFLGFLLTTIEHVTYIARIAREVLRHGLADD